MPQSAFPAKASNEISTTLGRYRLIGYLSLGHVPMVSAMTRGPIQYMTRFLQTAHTRHHTILSLIRTWYAPCIRQLELRDPDTVAV